MGDYKDQKLAFVILHIDKRPISEFFTVHINFIS